MAEPSGRPKTPGKGKPGLAARGAAVALLSRVLDKGELLSVGLEDPKGPLEGLAPEDRARAQRLATTTLRHIDRSDAVMEPYLRKQPPAPVLNVLRLATVEICQFGGAAHGVVDAAVDLVRRDRKTGHMSGLANAVLRKVGTNGPRHWAEMPAQELPDWLRAPLVAAYGEDAVEVMEQVQATEPPLDLTPRDGDAPALALTIEGAEALTTGSVRLGAVGRISGLPGYDTGAFWVQDAAAAVPARILAAQPGEAVLDLCAAPGGKTLQLAAAGAKVTALDVSSRRLTRLRENLERTGLSATVVTADALTWQGGPFDAILLDAPCSATGTIRRHPDLPFVKSGDDLASLLRLQSDLIDRALTLLKPGGRMVFCTCSLLPSEGEDQIGAALARHSGVVLDAAALDQPWIDPDWRGEHGLRLRPDFWADRGGVDGFFITALRKSDHDMGPGNA